MVAAVAGFAQAMPKLVKRSRKILSRCDGQDRDRPPADGIAVAFVRRAPMNHDAVLRGDQFHDDPHCRQVAGAGALDGGRQRFRVSH